MSRSCAMQVQELVGHVQKQLQLSRGSKAPRSRQLFLAGAAEGLAAVLGSLGGVGAASGQLPEDLRLQCAQVGAALQPLHCNSAC